MSNTDGRKTLGLGGSRPSNVKQSFSHGRTKNVVVETKRKRVSVPKPGAQSAAAVNAQGGKQVSTTDAEMDRRLKALQMARAREAEDTERREREDRGDLGHGRWQQWRRWRRARGLGGREGLGTTVIRNATGNLQFPRVSNKAVGTEATEVAADSGSGMEMDELSLTPTRVAANTKYSKQLILQGGAEVDALIANELAASMNAFVDDYAFDAIMASTDVDVYNTADAALSSTVANAMEAAVLAAGGNLGGASYVISPQAYLLSKSLAQVADVNALWENGRFNMYNAVATPYLVNDTLDATGTGGRMIFGNFQQGGILAYFGGIDLLVDPYSDAGTAQIALHVNRFFDFDLRQPGALSRAVKLS